MVRSMVPVVNDTSAMERSCGGGDRCQAGGAVVAGKEVEGIGRRGKADAAAGTEGVDGYFDQRSGVAREHPEGIFARRHLHGNGLVPGVGAAADAHGDAVDFVDGAGIGREDEDLGQLGMRQNGGGGGVERDLLPDVEPVEVDHGHGAADLIGDETVASESGGFRRATGQRRRRRQKQASAGDRETGHSPYSTARACYPDERHPAQLEQVAAAAFPRTGEMAEWLKAHAWKACIGETLSRVRIPLSPPVVKSFSCNNLLDVDIRHVPASVFFGFQTLPNHKACKTTYPSGENWPLRNPVRVL